MPGRRVQRTPRTTRHAWGTPDTDHVELVLRCTAGSDLVEFTYLASMPGAPDGLVTEVVISGAQGAYSLVATGSRLDLDDLFVLQGGLNFDATLSAILLEEGRFIVSVEGEPDRVYATAGAEKQFAAIIKACPIPQTGFAAG